MGICQDEDTSNVELQDEMFHSRRHELQKFWSKVLNNFPILKYFRIPSFFARFSSVDELNEEKTSWQNEDIEKWTHNNLHWFQLVAASAELRSTVSMRNFQVTYGWKIFPFQNIEKTVFTGQCTPIIKTDRTMTKKVVTGLSPDEKVIFCTFQWATVAWNCTLMSPLKVPMVFFRDKCQNDALSQV